MMAKSGKDRVATAENYRAFAREARGRSPQYEELATAIAADKTVLAFLTSLPKVKRQPNLLFAAACYLLGDYADIGSLRGLLATRRRELAATMLRRRTQTNEAARCATLLPALARLPQPLALIEVGASAGLTLLPDRYSYRYSPGDHRVTGTDPAAPVLDCEARGPVPLPDRVPDVAWRAGLDINPLDVTSDDDVRWLHCLVWPGETGRRERLDAALRVARRDPPAVHQGDLLAGLPDLARRAPAHATLVVFHSAVLAYITASDRERFATIVRGLDAVWLSNEGPGVLPGTGITDDREHDGFVLIQDGTTPLACTDGHGTWLDWLAERPMAKGAILSGARQPGASPGGRPPDAPSARRPTRPPAGLPGR
jgi:hypothetical protein